MTSTSTNTRKDSLQPSASLPTKDAKSSPQTPNETAGLWTRALGPEKTFHGLAAGHAQLLRDQKMRGDQYVEDAGKRFVEWMAVSGGMLWVAEKGRGDMV